MVAETFMKLELGVKWMLWFWCGKICRPEREGGVLELPGEEGCLRLLLVFSYAMASC